MKMGELHIVSLINVENSLDHNNMPIGHEMKVMKDYLNIFGYKAEVLSGEKYARKIEGRSKLLPYCIYIREKKSRWMKILCNYFVSLFLSRGELLIFIDIPEVLLWGLAFFKGKRKVIGITYMQWDMYIEKYLFNKPIRRYLVKKGLRYLDGMIITNPLYKPQKSYVKVPDYYITDEIAKYKKKEKRDGCVCLGEIRPEKDVEGLIRIIRKTDIFLIIAGSFQDKNIYRKLKTLQTKNIEIINKNLSYDIYMEYLSTYKYVILPYNMEHYKLVTSGILQEGIFVGSIPIAPQLLLKHNCIQGLGYNTISEIPKLIQLYENGEIKVENNLERYQYEVYKKKVVEFVYDVKDKK